MIEGIVYTYIGASLYGVYALTFVVVLVLHGLGLLVLTRRGPLGMPGWVFLQVLSLLVSILCFIWSGPRYQNLLVRDSQHLTLCLYQTVLVLSRSYPFRAFAVV